MSENYVRLAVFFQNITWFVQECVGTGVKGDPSLFAQFFDRSVSRSTESGVVSVDKDSI
jgi:hypothetical protein